MNDTTRLPPLVLECARDLFESYGVVLDDPSSEPAELHGRYCSGSVGFSGELRGNAIIAANEDLLRKMVTHVGLDPDTICVSDWVGELANQLVGRVKARLLSHGLTVMLAVPTSVVGTDLAFPTTGTIDRFVFALPTGALALHFCADVEAHYVLPPRAHPPTIAPPDCGEMLLF